MKRIGIIGGMSNESTLHYVERIHRQVNQKAGGLTSPEMMVYHVNFEEIRKYMLTNEWEQIGNILGNVARKLEAAGAEYIVIATNTIHKVANDIQRRIRIPLLHIADCVANECNERHITKVGLLGTKYTMTEDFLKNRLTQNGLEVFTPKSEEKILELDRIIFEELCKGSIGFSSRDYYIQCIHQMVKENQLEGIIFGCTEIEMLVHPKDVTIPIFDTTQAHINAIVKLVLEEDE